MIYTRLAIVNSAMTGGAMPSQKICFQTKASEQLPARKYAILRQLRHESQISLCLRVPESHRRCYERCERAPRLAVILPAQSRLSQRTRNLGPRRCNAILLPWNNLLVHRGVSIAR